jgi:hypothetical protein
MEQATRKAVRVDMPKAATMARQWADRAALFPSGAPPLVVEQKERGSVSIDFAADDGDDAVAVLSVGRKIPVAGRYPRRKGKPAVSSQQDGRGHYRRRRHCWPLRQGLTTSQPPLPPLQPSQPPPPPWPVPLPGGRQRRCSCCSCCSCCCQLGCCCYCCCRQPLGPSENQYLDHCLAHQPSLPQQPPQLQRPQQP